jgi:hypothetical protein
MPNSGPIGPKILEYEKYIEALQKLLWKEGERDVKLLEATVATWNDKPEFVTFLYEDQYPDLILATFTRNENYNRIEAGTPARLIVPRRKSFLRFKWPYHAKTRVRKMSSRQGYYGVNIATKLAVTHSIKAREWYDEGAKRRQPLFVRNVEKFMERMAKVIWV